MIICLNFSRSKDCVQNISFRNWVHYISFALKFIWNNLYIYHLYHLFGIIYSENVFLSTFEHHIVVLGYQENTFEWKCPWVPSIISCSLTYCFSYFSVFGTKSLLTFLYSNASIASIPWYSFLFCPIYMILLGDISKWEPWISTKK